MVKPAQADFDAFIVARAMIFSKETVIRCISLFKDNMDILQRDAPCELDSRKLFKNSISVVTWEKIASEHDDVSHRDSPALLRLRIFGRLP